MAKRRYDPWDIQPGMLDFGLGEPAPRRRMPVKRQTVFQPMPMVMPGYYLVPSMKRGKRSMARATVPFPKIKKRKGGRSEAKVAYGNLQRAFFPSSVQQLKSANRKLKVVRQRKAAFEAMQKYRKEKAEWSKVHPSAAKRFGGWVKKKTAKPSIYAPEKKGLFGFLRR
jgi:hypothetical protein